MRPVLIRPENSWWKKAPGCLAAAVIVPVAMVVRLLVIPFERPTFRSAAEVAHYLRDFIEGSGDDLDFDEFESIAISDPRLDFIRLRASSVSEPMTEEGLATLRALLAEAEALAEEDDAAPFRSS